MCDVKTLGRLHDAVRKVSKSLLFHDSFITNRSNTDTEHWYKNLLTFMNMNKNIIYMPYPVSYLLLRWSGHETSSTTTKPFNFSRNKIKKHNHNTIHYQETVRVCREKICCSTCYNTLPLAPPFLIGANHSNLGSLNTN